MEEDVRERVLEENMEEILSKPNTLTARADQTKITADKDTGIPCITVYGTRKIPERYPSGRRKLRLKDTVRKEIDGVPTDFVVFESPDFEMGRTSIGDKPPHIQRRMMGVVKDEE